jgi:hypothetical protein
MRTLAPILAIAAILCGCGSEETWKNQAFAFAPTADHPAESSSTNIIALTHVGVSPLFQGRSFTYLVAPNRYETDPYAGFLIPPDRAIAEPIRASLAALGRVVQPGGALTPNLGAEVTVTKLYGDFQQASAPSATLQIHFVLYQMTPEGPGRILMDDLYGRSTSMTAKTPAALIAAWDTGLHDIMSQINSDYAKANSNDSR